jgi:opacity protein-like surface antigen
MKILKQVLSLLLLTTSTSFAEGMYFKAQLGMNKFNDIRNFDDFKQKSNFSPEIALGAGIGLHFDDSFRGDITAGYTKVSFHNDCKLKKFYDTHLNTKKVVINSIMLNIYKGFLDVADNIKLFAGVGLGISQINETIYYKMFLPDNRNRRNIITVTGATHRKTVYNFSHNVTFGFDFEVSDRFNVETAYYFKHHGVTKSKKMPAAHLEGKLYRSHGIYTGIRYEF